MERNILSGHVENMPDATNAAIAERLRDFRIAMGYSGHGDKQRYVLQIWPEETEPAKALARYYNTERGLSVSRETIRRIVVRFPGVTEGWFYRGDPAGLSYDMAVKLGLVDLGKSNMRTL